MSDFAFAVLQLRDPEFRLRFWSRIDVRGDQHCWLWQGSPDDGGYGHLGIGGRAERAHRVAFALSGISCRTTAKMRERGRGREGQRENRRHGFNHPQVIAAAKRRANTTEGG